VYTPEPFILYTIGELYINVEHLTAVTTEYFLIYDGSDR